MKCTKNNVEAFCNCLQRHLEDENGRGEFDDETELSTACETVIEWLKEAGYK